MPAGLEAARDEHVDTRGLECLRLGDRGCGTHGDDVARTTGGEDACVRYAEDEAEHWRARFEQRVDLRRERRVIVRLRRRLRDAEFAEPWLEHAPGALECIDIELSVIRLVIRHPQVQREAMRSRGTDLVRHGGDPLGRQRVRAVGTEAACVGHGCGQQRGRETAAERPLQHRQGQVEPAHRVGSGNIEIARETHSNSLPRNEGAS
jgi:hypothetical protein